MIRNTLLCSMLAIAVMPIGILSSDSNNKHQAPEQSEQETQESRDQQERRLWGTADHEIKTNRSAPREYESLVNIGMYTLGCAAVFYGAGLGAEYGLWGGDHNAFKMLALVSPGFGVHLAAADQYYNYHFTDEDGNDLSDKSDDDQLKLSEYARSLVKKDRDPSKAITSDRHNIGPSFTTPEKYFLRTRHHARTNRTPAPILMAKNLVQGNGLQVNG